jgi:hypothetical protein
MAALALAHGPRGIREARSGQHGPRRWNEAQDGPGRLQGGDHKALHLDESRCWACWVSSGLEVDDRAVRRGEAPSGVHAGSRRVVRRRYGSRRDEAGSAAWSRTQYWSQRAHGTANREQAERRERSMSDPERERCAAASLF